MLRLALAEGKNSFKSRALNTQLDQLHRICVGQNFAMQSLHINIATFLWALNFDRVIGPDGREILPSKIDFIDTGLTV